MLIRLAILIWAAWLGLIGLLAGLLVGRVWHPHFLPVTAVLGVILIAALALLLARGGG